LAQVTQELLRCIAALPIDRVDVRNSEPFFKFELATCELQRARFDSVPPSDVTPLYLNLHSIMLLHGFMAYGVTPGVSFKSLRTPFARRVQYSMMGSFKSLDDIERTLMGKSSHIHRIASDPRVYMAACFGTVGSARARVYDAEGLEEQLTSAAHEFVERELEMHRVKTPIQKHGEGVRFELPKVFKWCAEHFRDNRAAMVKYYLRLLPPAMTEGVVVPSNPRVSFRKFGWQVAPLPALIHPSCHAPLQVR
jgi:hypothetical protein